MNGRKSESRAETDKAILELQIQVEVAKATETLRLENRRELERLADEKHIPKFNKLRSFTAVAISILIVSNLWALFGIKDRIKTEAAKIIDQKLIDPQLTNTLNEALSQRAIPYIAAQVRPIETNLAALSGKIDQERVASVAINLQLSNNQVELSSAQSTTLLVSNEQRRLSSDQALLAEQVRPLSAHITSLQSSIDTAEAQAEKLQQEQKLISLLNRAELFDKEAIIQLSSIAAGTNEVADLAQGMLDKAQRLLTTDRGTAEYIVDKEILGTNSYSGPFGDDELAMLLLHSKSELLGGINLAPNKPAFVPKLVEIAQNTKDLWIVNRAAKKLGDIAGVSFYPWDLKPLNDWWMQYGTNYETWPFQQLVAAEDSIHRCQYAEALTNLNIILNVDPSAERCRAFAISCAIELGDVQKAQQLNTNFDSRNGRWSQWAHARIILATNVDEGTKAYASLRSKYPTMETFGLIASGNHMLRQIDWTLFSQLAKPTNEVPAVNANSRSLP